MLPFEQLEFVFQKCDALAEQTAVGFKLLFAWATQPDTTFFSIKVSPAAYQARCEMLQLCQLHLQFTFMAAGALRKDIENQAGAVNDTTLQFAFKVALLGWRQFVIEDHDTGLMQMRGIGYFSHLTLAGIGSSIWSGTLATDDGVYLYACTGGKQMKLFETFGKIAITEIKLNQNRGIARGQKVKQGE